MEKTTIRIIALSTLLVFFGTVAEAKKWTLQECLSYALSNNITLQRARLTKASAHEDVLQAQAQLLPSLSASTSHVVAYTPFPETGRAQVTNGYVESSVDKVSYNGSYGINANWTMWNGNQNHNLVKLNKLIEQKAEVDSAVTANSIQEQIAQLYVQILYSAEAIKVNQQSLEASKKNEERGKEMVKVGSMSKAELSQLTAQRAQDEYNIVAVESNMRDYTRQLKQLLQITNDDNFEVETPTEETGDALQAIPALTQVYEEALSNRPEIKSSQLAIEQNQLNLKIAKAQSLPSVALTAGVSTNSTTLNDNAWGTQLKNNLGLNGGVTVSIPIFDQRKKKTAVSKALISIEDSKMQLRDQETQLYATIENYWIQATTNQAKYRSSVANTKSQQDSYDMLSEQFRLGLKNIVELMNGKTNLITAQQEQLQSKYLTLLNINMLKFYMQGEIK
ncbi:MAG: TolC family protein [Prevotella sp.]|nr:TolC family protein [Prevotella sp.]MDY5258824.1 TolC family protein [Prevotella sp.]